VEGESVKLGAGFTVNEAVPEAVLYSEVLLESGVYVAVNVSLPVASDPAGTSIVALPPLSVAGAEV
jgi:hypothetical protein